MYIASSSTTLLSVIPSVNIEKVPPASEAEQADSIASLIIQGHFSFGISNIFDSLCKCAHTSLKIELYLHKKSGSIFISQFYRSFCH